MKRLALLLPLLALAACRDNGASVQIQQICAPTKTCSFTGKCDAQALGNPVWDPTVTEYVTLILQVSNLLPDNSNKEAGKLNTNDAHVDSATIDYGGAMGGTGSTTATGDIPANGTSVVWVDVVPVASSGPITASTSIPAFPAYAGLTAKIRLRGYLDDGTRFETAQFPVVIQVSTGTSTHPDAYVPSPTNTTVGLQCTLACPHVGQWPGVCM